MADESTHEITRILEGFEAGREDLRGAEQLFRAAYAELRRQAGRLMRRERVGHTLQPTALVNEAYLKLVDQTRVGWKSRAHFFGIAARAMRQVLVDHARRHAADKRGGDWNRVSLDESLLGADGLSLEILALHHALDELAARDERLAHVVELRVFAGLTAPEAAEVLGVSTRTVDSDWKVARMWLSRALSERDGP